MFGWVPHWFPAFVFDLVIQMIPDALFNVGLGCVGLGLVMFYCVMWVLLCLLVWLNIADKSYGLAFVSLSGLVLVTGIGILCIVLVIE